LPRRILITGDTHIPDRATSIPRLLLNYISDHAPWEMVLFTGDLTGENVLKWLKTISKDLYIVQGNMDYLSLPRQVTVEINWLKVGLIHGDGVYPRGNPVELSKIARRLGVQVLVSGHTHADFTRIGIGGNTLLLNPGSLTGVWGGGGGSYKPSLMVLEIPDQECVVVEVYRLNKDILEHTTSNYCFKSGVWS